MRSKILILLLQVIQLTVSNLKQSYISVSMNEIIKNHYVKKSVQYDFVVTSNTSKTLDVLEKTLKPNQQLMHPHRVIKNEDNSCDIEDAWLGFDAIFDGKIITSESTFFHQDNSAICLFDTFEDFWIFDNKLKN